MLDFRVLTGAEVEAALDDLARLRIAVFRDWPYLYDGDMAYERDYMAGYRDNAAAILVGAFDGTHDGAQLVGASTGTPMEDHAEEFAAPLQGWDTPLDEVFYCAESVLLPGYRGQGAGRAFFAAREDHARRLGRRLSAFCAVVRPGDHPLRPGGYRPLDPFWRALGYAPLEGRMARFSWKDVDQAEATRKPLQFWAKPL